MRTFTCPYCGAQSQVEDRFAGQSGTCATCFQPITIPVGVASPQARTARSRTSVGVIATLVMLAAVTGITATVIIGWLLLPAVAVNHAVAQRYACGNNLKQIALALANYHDDYQSYPPAYVTDKKGKPMHSWRVLLLPYLNAQDVYDKYNFDEPWNGPSNLLLTGSMPAVYFCPENPDQAARRAGETSYMVVVGKQTMFPYDKAVSNGDVADGTSNTIMVVETKTPGINWLSPVDLELDTMTKQINAGSTDPGSFHAEGGINVVAADGAVHFLPDDTRGKALFNSLTRDGGEPAHLNALP